MGFGGGDGWVMSQDHRKRQETGGLVRPGAGSPRPNLEYEGADPAERESPPPRSLGIPTNLGPGLRRMSLDGLSRILNFPERAMFVFAFSPSRKTALPLCQ